MGEQGTGRRSARSSPTCRGGVAETWKDNVLDEITKGTSEVETMEELFEKMREEFGEFNEESRKVDELRLLVQGPRTYDKYI